jgi:hypothetical protein
MLMSPTSPDSLGRTLTAFTPAEADDGASPAPAVPTGGERFETLQVVGQGGMGRVLAATDAQFGRRVAVKELLPSFGSSQGVALRRRFVVESVVTANLEHPGVPPVYERGRTGEREWFAMRLVEGEHLAVALHRSRTHAERMTYLPALIQVAHTLGFAHARGVVHRDVKPENIMLGQHGQVLLVDWGIARVDGFVDLWSAREFPVDADSDGDVFGTLAYMAPEQARGANSDITPATDVYAVGAILFELLTGRRARSAETRMASLMQAAEGTPPEFKRDDGRVPKELRDIVARCLAPRPEHRFADGGALAAALENFVSGAVAAPRERWAWWLGAGVGAASLVLVAALVVVLQGIMPSLREQGVFGFLYPALTAASALLAAVEWRTGGRLDMSRLGLSLGLLTAALGVAGTFLGYACVAGLFVDTPETLDTPKLLVGFREASGNLISASLLAGVQCAMWGLVSWLVALRSRAR